MSEATAPPPAPAPLLAGIDFTSRPSRRKPITVAHGRLVKCDAKGKVQGEVHIERIDEHIDFDSFARWLQNPGPWLAAFDFPFGLPRELVESLGWPLQWPALMRHYAQMSRAEVRNTFAAFCAARPAGGKFAHRATDGPAGSSPSMKWVNPPVAYMLHAGVPLLMDAGVDLPGLHAGDPARIALEGYPGLLAREVLGGRSYKSDAPARQTVERQTARRDLVDALRAGRTRLGLRLCTTEAQRDMLIADASADRLDAVLCLMQAAWASTRARYGLPENVDPIEGWIVSAG